MTPLRRAELGAGVVHLLDACARAVRAAGGTRADLVAAAGRAWDDAWDVGGHPLPGRPPEEPAGPLDALLPPGARVSVAGRPGSWAAWVWLEDGATRRGLGATAADAVREALGCPERCPDEVTRDVAPP